MQLPKSSLIKQLSLFSVLRRPHNRSQYYVPKHSPVNETDVDILQKFIDNSERLLVITGAGISTESGIPDYRSEKVGLYARNSEKPHHQYKDFQNKVNVRQYYWANSFVNWTKFSSFSPNKTHTILSEWERKGILYWLVTQNVDGLHSIAGNQNQTELHGSLYRINCLQCKHTMTRFQLQEMMERNNPIWNSKSVNIAPDEHGLISQEQANLFEVPSCNQCGGMLKPDIIFFGNTVPECRRNFVLEKVKESDSLLVLGSSLQVHSAYRFVKAAHIQKKPIAIVNIGPTRANKDMKESIIKINAKCSDILECLQDKRLKEHEG